MSLERHIGFATGLAYALAQHDEAHDDQIHVTMPVDEEWFDRELWAQAIKYLNEECEIFYYKVLVINPGDETALGAYWDITLATTEGRVSFQPDDDWNS